jgi:hypothetical protein
MLNGIEQGEWLAPASLPAVMHCARGWRVLGLCQDSLLLYWCSCLSALNGPHISALGMTPGALNGVMELLLGRIAHSSCRGV